MKPKYLLGISLFVSTCFPMYAQAQQTFIKEYTIEGDHSLLADHQPARPKRSMGDSNRFVEAHPLATLGASNKILQMGIDDKTCSDAFKLNPSWMSKPEVVYIPCPEIKVGIGTDAPEEKLDVRGTAIISTGLKLGINTVHPQSAFIDALKSESCTRPLIRFMTEDAGVNKTLFLVKNDGGIYCTSARIRVKDDIPVPDFVFRSDYHLMPLQEVKTYVDQHLHLPGVPSEREIREEGLSLEEMQLKLLQKVEELTLYMINLEQKNIELTLEIEQLKCNEED